jgi:hypothetical protein
VRQSRIASASDHDVFTTASAVHQAAQQIRVVSPQSPPARYSSLLDRRDRLTGMIYSPQSLTVGPPLSWHRSSSPVLVGLSAIVPVAPAPAPRAKTFLVLFGRCKIINTRISIHLYTSRCSRSDPKGPREHIGRRQKCLAKSQSACQCRMKTLYRAGYTPSLIPRHTSLYPRRQKPGMLEPDVRGIDTFGVIPPNELIPIGSLSQRASP